MELRGNTTGGRRCWSWDGEVTVLFSQTPEGLDLPLDVFFKNVSGEASVLCPEVNSGERTILSASWQLIQGCLPSRCISSRR